MHGSLFVISLNPHMSFFFSPSSMLLRLQDLFTFKHVMGLSMMQTEHVTEEAAMMERWRDFSVCRGGILEISVTDPARDR